MKAAVLTEAKTFEIAEVPDPVAGPGQLVLRVEACGICGSDLKAAANMPTGLVMGHEFCGSVVEVGAGSSQWQVGQRVTALPLIGCGACLPCLQGDVSHCERGSDNIGVGGSSGAYAEFIKVGSRETFALPPDFGPGVGALIEPLAVGLHAVDRTKPNRGDVVAVIGGGPVGQAVALWARFFGAREVIVSDPVEGRRAQCERMGATQTIDPAAAPLPTFLDAQFGRRADLVFECVGVPGMVQAAVDACVTHGRVVIVGVCTKPDSFVPVTAVVKELAMYFVVYYRSGDFAFTIDMMRQGRIDPLSLITDRVDLAGFPAAFEALKKPTTQSKVLVLPNG